MPEINPIRPPKPKGGKRPGAGRKPNYFKRLQIKPMTAAEVLARYDEVDSWRWFLTHKDADIRLKALVYLTDRRDGKPRQAVEVSGGIIHAHTTYRNPALAGLTAEELQALDAVTKKLALPAPDPLQTQPGAPTEAIEGELVSEDHEEKP